MSVNINTLALLYLLMPLIILMKTAFPLRMDHLPENLEARPVVRLRASDSQSDRNLVETTSQKYGENSFYERELTAQASLSIFPSMLHSGKEDPTIIPRSDEIPPAFTATIDSDKSILPPLESNLPPNQVSSSNLTSKKLQYSILNLDKINNAVLSLHDKTNELMQLSNEAQPSVKDTTNFPSPSNKNFFSPKSSHPSSSPSEKTMTDVPSTYPFGLSTMPSSLDVHMKLLKENTFDKPNLSLIKSNNLSSSDYYSIIPGIISSNEKIIKNVSLELLLEPNETSYFNSSDAKPFDKNIFDSKTTSSSPTIAFKSDNGTKTNGDDEYYNLLQGSIYAPQQEKNQNQSLDTGRKDIEKKESLIIAGIVSAMGVALFIVFGILSRRQRQV